MNGRLRNEWMKENGMLFSEEIKKKQGKREELTYTKSTRFRLEAPDVYKFYVCTVYFSISMSKTSPQIPGFVHSDI